MAEKTNWVLIVLVAAVVYMFASSGVKAPTTNIGYQPPVADQCAYQPTDGYVGSDRLIPGNTETATNYSFYLNGAYVGTTHPSVKKGDVWKVLAQYNQGFGAVAEKTIECGVNNFVFSTTNQSEIGINIAPGIQLGSGQFLTNQSTMSGGASNESAITSTRTLTVSFQSDTQQATGDMLYVLESPASSAANISSISLTCGGKAMTTGIIPSYLSAANANSFRAAWDIPSVENGAKLDCALQIVPAVGKQPTGGFVTTAYVKNKFIDIDGTLKEGIYDSNGNIKYIKTQVASFQVCGTTCV